MKKFSFIEHTADVRLALKASTLPELFEVAVEGMAHIILPVPCKGKPDVNVVVAISARDTTALLIDFLSEVLSQTHVMRTVFCSVAMEEFSETHIRARLYGNRVEYFEEDIKAVTYHEAAIKKTKEGLFETIVVFDI